MNHTIQLNQSTMNPHIPQNPNNIQNQPFMSHTIPFPLLPLSTNNWSLTQSLQFLTDLFHITNQPQFNINNQPKFHITKQPQFHITNQPQFHITNQPQFNITRQPQFLYLTPHIFQHHHQL